MIINTIPTTQCQPQTIVIGRRGTYDTMQIAFDLSYLVESYGNGVAVLAVKRSQDESAYPAIVTQEDNTLTWTISDTDTYYVGSGECQLMWYVDGGLAKTIIYPMVVMRDILQTAEQPPDGYENWIEHLTELGAETQQNAQNAAQSASDASTAKDDAVTAKEAAEAAQEAAETAVTHYPVIINGYWNVWSVETQTYVSTGIKAKGEDGYSPEVTITTITGGHRVTITDKDHPTGQSFDVLDGQGGGGSSDYATLSNKPKINNVELNGNKTAHDLGLAAQSDIPTVPVQSVNGKTGAVNLASGDIAYDESATYQAGSVGAELQEQTRQLSDLEDTVSTTQIINTASGAIASFSDGADSMPVKKLVAQIEPVQDLHGYENPWPAGGGANKFGGDALKTALLTVTGATEGSDANGNYVNLPASGTLNDVILFSDFEENQQYTIIFKILPTGSRASNIRVYYADNTAQTFSTSGDGQLETVSYTTAAGKTVVSIRLGYWYTSTCKVYYDSCGVFVGAAQTFAPYENICPISGHTGAEIYHEAEYDADADPAISVNWEDEAGTVYGGTLDVTNGVLTVDMALNTVNGSQALTSNGVLPFGGAQIVFDPSPAKKLAPAEAVQNEGLFSDKFSHDDNYGSSKPYLVTGRAVNGKLYFSMPAGITTAVQAREWFTNNPTQISYLLANPITYQLTPQELNTLLGTNNIWSDTGDTEVTYPADTKLYIDNKITQAIAAALNT